MLFYNFLIHLNDPYHTLFEEATWVKTTKAPKVLSAQCRYLNTTFYKHAGTSTNSLKIATLNKHPKSHDTQ